MARQRNAEIKDYINMNSQRPTFRRAAGFTLIELLVVISIIAVIMSVLLPSLSGARRAAMTVVCQTRLKEVITGVTEYGVAYGDWIVGSPTGSGGYLNTPISYGPAVQTWDFMGPLAKQWGIWLPEEPTVRDAIKRFNIIRSLENFACPANPFLAARYDGPDAGAGPMISFNTSRYMLMEHEDRYTGTGSAPIGAKYYDNGHEEKVPRNWSPRLTRVGDASRKVFCADGARYSTVDVAPDYDLTTLASWGGSFSDASPYSTFTRSWDRSGRSAGFDARLYAFRHSIGAPVEHAPSNALKMDMVFFDGHVERKGDLEAANPTYWLPAGSQLEINTSSIYEDVVNHYGLTGTININN